jgi:tRNA G10  N-methylase Trm11
MSNNADSTSIAIVVGDTNHEDAFDRLLLSHKYLVHYYTIESLLENVSNINVQQVHSLKVNTVSAAAWSRQGHART